MTNEEIIEAFKEWCKDRRPVVSVTQDERDKDPTGEIWESKGKPYSLLLDTNYMVFHDLEWVAFFEVGYGNIVLLNTRTKQIEMCRDGVFRSDFCILGDYYGFPRLALFTRAN